MRNFKARVTMDLLGRVQAKDSKILTSFEKSKVNDQFKDTCSAS